MQQRKIDSIDLDQFSNDDATLTQQFTCSCARDSESAFDSVDTGLQERIMPPDSIHVKREVHLTA